MTRKFYILKNQTQNYQKGDLVMALNQKKDTSKELSSGESLDTSTKTIQVLYFNFFYEGPNRRDACQVLNVPLSGLSEVEEFNLESIVDLHLKAQSKQVPSFPSSLSALDPVSRRRLLTQYMFFESQASKQAYY